MRKFNRFKVIIDQSGFIPLQMKASATEEKRIQQQILVQQKKELTTFLDTQKKQYRLCRDRMKEVSGVQTKVLLLHSALLFLIMRRPSKIYSVYLALSYPLNITLFLSNFVPI